MSEAATGLGSVAHPRERLVLASASPRRASVLHSLGLDFAVDPADVDETRRPGEGPGAFAERLAREKALVVASRQRDALVIAGDTIVVLGDDVLGKPDDRAGATAMLMRLQGRSHVVATGLALAHRDRVVSGVDRTLVRFRSFDRDEAEAYVDTGECLDKAGAYGIQGRGAALVAGVEGDYFTVMGFSVSLFVELLKRSGRRYAFGRVEPQASGASR